jgi:hypothetical protein
VDDLAASEILTIVFVGLGFFGGGAYGWLVAGTVWAIIGGAVVMGLVALVVATVIAFAFEAVAGLFRRGRTR